MKQETYISAVEMLLYWKKWTSTVLKFKEGFKVLILILNDKYIFKYIIIV